MRPIDADALKTKKRYSAEFHENVVAVAEIDWMPTIDAVQVVRCKDCVHGIYGTDETGEYRWCENACNYVDDDAYCADGERKEKDNAKGES